MISSEDTHKIKSLINDQPTATVAPVPDVGTIGAVASAFAGVAPGGSTIPSKTLEETNWPEAFKCWYDGSSYRVAHPCVVLYLWDAENSVWRHKEIVPSGDVSGTGAYVCQVRYANGSKPHSTNLEDYSAVIVPQGASGQVVCEVPLFSITTDNGIEQQHVGVLTVCIPGEGGGEGGTITPDVGSAVSGDIKFKGSHASGESSGSDNASGLYFRNFDSPATGQTAVKDGTIYLDLVGRASDDSFAVRGIRAQGSGQGSGDLATKFFGTQDLMIKGHQSSGIVFTAVQGSSVGTITLDLVGRSSGESFGRRFLKFGHKFANYGVSFFGASSFDLPLDYLHTVYFYDGPRAKTTTVVSGSDDQMVFATDMYSGLTLEGVAGMDPMTQITLGLSGASSGTGRFAARSCSYTKGGSSYPLGYIFGTSAFTIDIPDGPGGDFVESVNGGTGVLTFLGSSGTSLSFSRTGQNIYLDLTGRGGSTFGVHNFYLMSGGQSVLQGKFYGTSDITIPSGGGVYEAGHGVEFVTVQGKTRIDTKFVSGSDSNIKFTLSDDNHTYKVDVYFL